MQVRGTSCYFEVRLTISTVDKLQNTAGDIALSFNNDKIYTLIRDAGIRAGRPLSPLHLPPH